MNERICGLHALVCLQVGGLGDVVSGLSKACIARGHNVSVIMPFYESLDNDQVTPMLPGVAPGNA